jgi:translation initiation factor IF-2
VGRRRIGLMEDEGKVEVEERRIQPTVIRRRKRVTEPELPLEEEAAAEAQQPASEVPSSIESAPPSEVKEEVPAAKRQVKKEPPQKEPRVVKIPKEKTPPARVVGRVDLKQRAAPAPPARAPAKAPAKAPARAPHKAAPLRGKKAAGAVEQLPLEVPLEKATRERKAKREKEELEEKARRKFRRRREVITIEEEVIEEVPVLRKGERVFTAHRPARKKVATRPRLKTQITTPKAIKKVIKISEVISVGELAQRMGAKVGDVVKRLMELGLTATVNQTIDVDTAALMATEFGYEVENVAIDVDKILQQTEDTPDTLLPRPPVVTIMGHVDHGKTLLLDAIRKSHLVDAEAGGITQHIGAYKVELDKGTIVFIDTPGHEAFTAMRARGAQVTDIVVVVVAADDGVMPQTIEAIDHAKAAEVPIIAAINKIDKSEADPERVKRDLSELGLVPEEWGGHTLYAQVSAKKRTGIDAFLELILLQAEMLDLKENPAKPGRGVVVEARLDRGRGPVGTVMVQEGTLKPGDVFVSGETYGRVKAMLDERGKQVREAGPATPIEVVGFTDIPRAGDDFISVEGEKVAKEVSLYRRRRPRGETGVRPERLSLEDLYDRIQQGEAKELRVVLKGDTHGSIQAIQEALERLSTDEVRIQVIHQGVGGISETDVTLAAASDAVIVGFNVSPLGKARKVAEQEQVDIRLYTIIYEVIEDVEKALKGLLGPIKKEVILGRAEVREIFRVSKIGAIAGSYVNEGKMVRGADVRLFRNGDVVHEGKISSLRRFKDDVREVQAGYECGVGVEGYDAWEPGDTIEAFTYEEVMR